MSNPKRTQSSSLHTQQCAKAVIKALDQKLTPEEISQKFHPETLSRAFLHFARTEQSDNMERTLNRDAASDHTIVIDACVGSKLYIPTYLNIGLPIQFNRQLSDKQLYIYARNHEATAIITHDSKTQNPNDLVHIAKSAFKNEEPKNQPAIIIIPRDEEYAIKVIEASVTRIKEMLDTRPQPILNLRKARL